MKCEFCEQFLSALIDGELAAETKSKVETHLSGCSGCRSLLDELRAVDQKLQMLVLPENGPANVVERVVVSTKDEPTSRRGFAWAWVAMAVAVCFAFAFFRAPAPVPTLAIAAHLVQATGSVEVLVDGDQQWRPLEVEGNPALYVGCHVRTSDRTVCEIETTDKATLRLDEDAEMVIQQSDRVKVVKGQVWCRAPKTKSIQVDTEVPPLPNLASMSCPSESEFQWTVGDQQASVRSFTSQQTIWSSESDQCEVKPGGCVTVDAANAFQPVNHDSSNKVWQLPLLASTTMNDELADVLEPLLVQIGSTKAGHVHETQIRKLGPAGAIPLLAYVQSQKSHLQTNIRIRAMRMASELADESGRGRLMALTGDHDREIAAMAVQTLERIEK